MCNAIDSAIEKGIKIGEERLATLLMILYSCQREDEAARACRDKAYRYDLYKKFHIV